MLSIRIFHTRKYLPLKDLRAYPVAVRSYGENAARLRGEKKQEEVSTRAGWKRPSFVTVLEGYRGTKVPTPKTIRRHAEALGVEPWQLLEGVETELDHLRKRHDLLRHGDPVESAHAESSPKSSAAHVGTQHAVPGASIRKAPHAEARLREEVAELRAAIDTIAQALVGLGTPEAPSAHSLAARKPKRGRRARQGA